jgi:hypothetical protein
MLGRQYGLAISDYTLNFSSLSELHNLLIDRLRESMDEYKYTSDSISSIQIIAYKVRYTEGVTPLYTNMYNKDNLGHNIDLIDIPKNHVSLVDYKILPLTMDLNKYRTTLNMVVDVDSNTVKHIILDNRKDFIELVNNKRVIPDFVVPSNSKVYISDNKKYITLINRDKTADNKTMHKINVFTIDGGHIFEAMDAALTNNTFTRIIGNLTKVIDIDNRSIVNSSIKVKLTHIKSKEIKDDKYDTANPFIGSLDLETYDSDGISKVYAVGFYTKKGGTKCYYIDSNTLDSDELIFRCLKDLVSSKYNGYTFYVHNLGGFDVYFLLGLLIKSDKYDVKLSCHGTNILSVTITGLGTKNLKVKYSIKLVDSYNILKASLDNLCDTYETKTVKGIYPYTFMNKNTLFYVGPKPAITFYNRNVNKVLYANEPSL